jgi:DNA-binding response OmpR family regulator
MITDIQLGDESGMDLVQMVRNQYGSSVPIIVVSGNIDKGTASRLERLGATRYLTKPVGRRKLFEEIENVLFKQGGA